MRRIAVLFVPLLVVLLQATAYAMDHWGRAFSTPPIPDHPTRVLWGVLQLILMIVALFLSIWYLLKPETGETVPTKSCMAFVAVGSVATAVLFLEYFLIGLQETTKVREVLANIILVAIYFYLVYAAMLALAGPCCLKKKSVGSYALRVPIIPAAIAAILVWLS